MAWVKRWFYYEPWNVVMWLAHGGFEQWLRDTSDDLNKKAGRK